MASDASQLRLPLDAGLKDRLQLVRMLEGVDVGLSFGRKQGVIELLVRLLLLARDPDAAEVVVEAQVSRIAAGFRDRKSASERTVRYWLAYAEALGLVSREWPGGARWCRFVFHWARVLELLERGRHPATPCNILQPLQQQAAIVAASTGRYKDSKEPLPVPVAAPGLLQEGKRRRRSTINTADVFDSVQALREARGRRLAPLPLGLTIAPGHAFACLREEHLNQCWSLLAWFRRQLSLPQPVLSPSEADFLLVLAAALWAKRLPDKFVRASRVAAFVHVLTRGQWGKVLPHLVDARAWLDRQCAERGPLPYGSFTAEDPTASVGAMSPGKTLVPEEEPCLTTETENL